MSRIGRLSSEGRAAVIILGIIAPLLFLLLCSCSPFEARDSSSSGKTERSSFEVPGYTGALVEVVDGDKPDFEGIGRKTATYVKFSALDGLGRCGTATALLGQELLPTEERSNLGEVTPTGWRNAEYPWVDEGWLYNRCHLIAFSLGGGDADARNLITGTRSFNVKGMLPLEGNVLRYIEKTGNHVLYRVTPVFEGRELVARGVLMEAESIEDGGTGIKFCRFVHNVEDGVAIDYSTGESASDGNVPGNSADTASSADAAVEQFVLNTNTRRFHHPDCDSVYDIKEKNRQDVTASRDALIEEGYKPCGICKP